MVLKESPIQGLRIAGWQGARWEGASKAQGVARLVREGRKKGTGVGWIARHPRHPSGHG